MNFPWSLEMDDDDAASIIVGVLRSHIKKLLGVCPKAREPFFLLLDMLSKCMLCPDPDDRWTSECLLWHEFLARKNVWYTEEVWAMSLDTGMSTVSKLFLFFYQHSSHLFVLQILSEIVTNITLDSVDQSNSPVKVSLTRFICI